MNRLLTILLLFTTLSSAYSSDLSSVNSNTSQNVLAESSHFSAYIFNDFKSGSGNANGSIAIGGNLDLGGYSIATKADALTQDYAMLVEGNAVYTNGRIYHGKVRVQGNVDIANAVIEGLPAGVEIENRVLAKSIQATQIHYQNVASQLRLAHVNGKTEFKWGGLYLKGDCNSQSQIFHIDGSTLAKSHTFSASCIPAGSTVVFNISGDDVSFKNQSLTTLLPHRDRVIFNFYEAKTLLLAGISVEGLLLAPHADIFAPHGDAQGTVIANSWRGSMHLGSVRFRGNLADLVNFNKAPKIISVPASEVTWPEIFTYPVIAIDEDKDPISFELVKAPHNVKINHWTGVIEWKTEFIVPGQYEFIVKVKDNKGNSDEQSFTVTLNSPANYAPEIISIPVKQAQIREQYKYQVIATDRDNDALVYSLKSAPKEMSIDEDTGLIIWPVKANQTGLNLVIVTVTDGKVVTQQNYNIEVTAPNNQAPKIISHPKLEAKVQQLYQYKVEATDPDNDTLIFELTQAPEGMFINSRTGDIDWVGQLSQAKSHEIRVKVTDEPGLFDEQIFILNLVEVGNKVPEITSVPVISVNEKSQYQYKITAQDDKQNELIYSLLKAPKGMNIDVQSGLIKWDNPDLYPQGRIIADPYCRIVQDKSTRVSGAADVYLVVDESGSMDSEHNWIPEMVPILDQGLLNSGVGKDIKNLYGVTGYEHEPRFLSSNNKFMHSIDTFRSVGDQLRLTWLSGTEDGYNAIFATLAKYEQRKDTAKNLILVTDEDRDIYKSNLNFSNTLENLKESKVVLNAVVNASFNCKDGTSAIGITANGTGFVADGLGGYYTCNNATATRGDGTTIRDYVDLAIATGGAAWDLNFLRSGGLRAKSFSKALIDIKVKEIVEQLPPILQSDIQLSNISLVQDDNSNFSIRVNAFNKGLKTIDSHYVIGIYSDKTLLGQVSLENLAIQATQEISISGLKSQAIGEEISAVVLSDHDECSTNNNIAVAQVIQVQVKDSDHATAQQLFTINVTDVNDPPVVATIPAVTLAVGESFAQTMEVSDVDVGEGLLFTLVNAPTAMTINASSGDIRWQPGQSDIGVHSIIVKATDIAGESSTTQFSINVLDFLRAPIISSQPLNQVTLGTGYYYQVVAMSDRNAPLSYRLAASPKGMTINSETGEVIWRPNIPTKDGGHNVIIEVIDDKNLVAIQSFNISVLAAGTLPEFISTPITFVKLGLNYFYQVQVAGHNDQAITIKLESGPEEMSLENQNLRWTPKVAGTFTVLLSAKDVTGGIAYQEFEIQVSTDTNLPPVITSSPKLQLNAEKELFYKILAQDPEGKELTYRLLSGPPGMNISSLGILTWPKQSQIDGKHHVTLRVSDPEGLFGQQMFSFDFYPGNASPLITSTPLGFAALHNQYIYQLSAVDPDGDPVTFSINKAPDGVSLTADNLIVWTPTENQLGSHFFEVQAEDSIGALTTQSFNILVREILNNAAPIINSTPVFDAFAGKVYKYKIQATDPDGHTVIYRLGDVPDGVTLSDEGVLSWIPNADQKGAQLLKVRAFDSYGAFGEQIFSVNVNSGGTPVITSIPARTAYSGLVYNYQLEATDLDNETLGFSLITSPTGMEINISGLISWVPQQKDIGTHTIQIKVQDSVGNYDLQKYNLLVRPRGEGTKPHIVSSPKESVNVGRVFEYEIIAEDPDGDDLFFAISQAPMGMKIDEKGLIQWQPQANQIGKHVVEAKVEDITGLSDIQKFQIQVINPYPNNSIPEIRSQPVTEAFFEGLYEYQIIAFDADKDAMSYRLESSVPGMTIDQSGMISWEPTKEQQGNHIVNVRVSDQYSYVNQTFFVFVMSNSLGNQLPDITSQPIESAVIDKTYNYAVKASDNDGDKLSYSFFMSPTGMTIDSQSGVIEWMPTRQQLGTHAIQLAVDDGKGKTLQRFDVQVYETPPVLQAELYLSDKQVELNGKVAIFFDITGGNHPVEFELKVNGVTLEVDSVGYAEVIATQYGRYDIVLSASDSSETIVLNDYFTVINPNDNLAPVVEIISPIDGDKYTAIEDIVGTVFDENLAEYNLYISEAGKSSWQKISSGKENVGNSNLGKLDTTLLNNGQYDLVLQAIDVNGETASTNVTISIEGDLKVGNFSVTFTDVSIPLTGIPIEVNRTYDSRNKSKSGDLGFGWSIDYQNVSLHESRVLGKNWKINSYRSGPLGLIPNLCVEPNGIPLVSVTLPNGKVEKFEVEASPKCTQVYPTRNVKLEFKPKDKTLSKLEIIGVNRAYLDGNTLLDTNAFSKAFDPDQYLLTTIDGYKYFLDQEFGIKKIETPTKETITYADDGITHSNGMGVEFYRDVLNRITMIKLPDGNSINYRYDANGNLHKYIDELTLETSYIYNRNHGLLDIFAANGMRLTRNEYDDKGRLIAQIDEKGARIEFTYNVEGRSQVVRDRRGNTKVYVYDDVGNVISETNALGEAITRTFDDRQNVLSQTDAEGNLTQWTYDEKGYKTSNTNALGDKTIFSYGPFGKLGKEIDDDGHVLLSNDYEVDGSIIKSINALGQVSHYVYSDLTGELESFTDEVGVQAKFTYRKSGTKDVYYIETKTDSSGTTTTYERDSLGRVLSESINQTLADGTTQVLTTRFTLDAKGQVIATTYPDGSQTHSEYDVFGNEIVQIDQLGRRTEHLYDGQGNLVQTIYPDNTSVAKLYDAENNLVEQTERNGAKTFYEYDRANRLVKTTSENGSFTSNEYNKAGHKVATIDVHGNRTEYTYDAAGQNTKITDAVGHTTQFEYDKRGNRTVMVDAKGKRTEYNYDLADRLIKTTFADGSFTSTSYDARGRRTAETDAQGMMTHYHYDGSGRLIKVVDAQGNPTTYTYDELGNKLTQTDAQGRKTSWTYDKQGNQITRTLPMGQVESFSYDAQGNQLSHTDFNGNTTLYSYDQTNRVTRLTYADGSTESYSYDNHGNRTTASYTSGTLKQIWLYNYDGQNRLIKETKPSGEQLAYTYDNAGNKTKLFVIYQDGTTQTESYQYDSLNRLISVTDHHKQVTSYGYDANGNRISQSNSNGTSTIYHYDDLNRLIKVNHYTAQGGLMNSFEYTLDKTGRRTSISESNGSVTSYSYDNLYRLTAENITDVTNGHSTTSYSYDSVGNRLAQTHNSASTSYVYDSNDRVVSESNSGATDIAVTSYHYDNNGNTLVKDINGSQVIYSFDMRNRLVSMDATALENGVQASYQYNIDGIRTHKTVNHKTTHYLIDNSHSYAQVIAETDSLGSRLKTYLYGDDLISQTDTGHTTSTYHYDGLGSTRLLTDESGQQSDSYNYSAYGELRNQTGKTDNTYLFTGEQFDSDLAQYYLRARYYDQAIGRFTRQDEWMGRVGEPVTLNKYLYTHADPVNWVDPSGYMSLGSLGTAQHIQGVLINTAHQHVFKKAFKNFGCELGFALAEESIKHGIYVLYDSVGSRYYVGQTGENVGIDNRHTQHLNEAKRKARNAWKANTKVIARFFVDGGSGALDKMEQFIIDILEADGHNLRNEKRVIGDSPERNKIRKEFRALKNIMCK